MASARSASAERYALWQIDADGTNLRKLTSVVVPPFVDGPSDNLPQVSPDGTRIAFHRNVVTCSDPRQCGCRIVVTNINGGNPVELTDPSLNAQIPNWSPDSRRIVFEFDPPGGVEIGIINADGTGFHQLTFGNGKRFSFAPSFSPDGTKIVFARYPSTGSSFDLFTMNPDGSGLAQLTKTPALEWWAQWAVAAR